MKSWRRPLPLVLIGIAATLVLACIVGGSAFLVVGGLRLRNNTLQFQGPSMEPTIYDGGRFVTPGSGSKGTSSAEQ